MTWTKTGDEFADECWTLTDAAYRLHHEGLTWSNRKGTEGQLAKDDMRRWAKRPEAAEELVSVGWWEDHGQHYQIVHHLGYQRTREQVAHQSLVNAKNGKKGGRPRKQKTELVNEPLSESQTETESEGDRTGQDRPGQRNRGTSLSNGQRKSDGPDLDADYAADLREWCEQEP
ncbi:hypothetical protein [Mycobacterium scrofulaceum]|uniref:hypothetical protein n=1 Tax=Mycobacterium scrofulaceum TaxID=1783 RepID=UPI000A5F1E67|nr:hypothetical protein [Mycobacterium scrofulaceum]